MCPASREGATYDGLERRSTGSTDLELGFLSTSQDNEGSVHGRRAPSLRGAAALSVHAMLRAQLHMQPQQGIGRQSAWSATQGDGRMLAVLPPAVPPLLSAGRLGSYAPPRIHAERLRSSYEHATEPRLENDLSTVECVLPTAVGAGVFEHLHRQRPGRG